MYIYDIYIHSFILWISYSRSSILIVHREETAAGQSSTWKKTVALVAEMAVAALETAMRQRWMTVRARRRNGGGAGGDKAAAQLCSMKTKATALRSRAPVAYIGADPLAPARGWNRC